MTKTKALCFTTQSKTKAELQDQEQDHNFEKIVLRCLKNQDSSIENSKTAEMWSVCVPTG